MVVLDVFQSTFVEFLERRHGQKVLEAVKVACRLESNAKDVEVNMGM